MSEWESWPFCKKCSLAAAAKFIVTMACGMSPEMFKMIAEMQQKGLASAGYQGFWMPNQERRVQGFHETLNDLMSL